MHIDGCTMSQDDDALFDPDSDGELNPDDEDEERPELTNDQLKVSSSRETGAPAIS